ncbi:calcium-binding protein [Lutimaribacter marinistellae]|uniref:Calcium-binding protein n=1 Tax=Lutimaribacter marinistellae TaxID=1820329 RepID=A0ABV7TBM9_9RHOB
MDIASGPGPDTYFLQSNDEATTIRGSLQSLTGDLYNRFSPGDLVVIEGVQLTTTNLDVTYGRPQYFELSPTVIRVNTDADAEWKSTFSFGQRTFDAPDWTFLIEARTVGDDTHVSLQPLRGLVITGTDGPDDLKGQRGNDRIEAGDGADRLDGNGGEDTLVGGAGDDIYLSRGTIVEEADGGYDQVVIASWGQPLPDHVEGLRLIGNSTGAPYDVLGIEGYGNELDNRIEGTSRNYNSLYGEGGNDTLIGADRRDYLYGGDGDDRIETTGAGSDQMHGGDGRDTLIGGEGDDTLTGGETEDDLRDELFGQGGDDSVDGGYGNDLIYGGTGDDTLNGGFGTDFIAGQQGNDQISGGALSDELFGNDGDDFLNGGFGYDRLNGGAGADRFFHLGVVDHGSDWVQDYNADEDDVLIFGQGAAGPAQFQINYNHSTLPGGDRSGDDMLQEAFIIHRPTGQILWALVDGEGQDAINLQIGGELFDLLA